MFLFDVASRQMKWLADRQSVTAQNIANADTPGYRSKDIEPFSSVLDGTAMSLTATAPGHMAMDAAGPEGFERQAGDSWGSAHSRNNVSVEQELMVASSSVRMMSFDASLTRSFQRMLLASVKV